jgi:hypothetical protein
MLAPQLATVRDPGEGMSGRAGPMPNANPCDAKDSEGRPESIETLET